VASRAVGNSYVLSDHRWSQVSCGLCESVVHHVLICLYVLISMHIIF